jgi:adenylylsulfate kinase-like enzyme
MIVWLTGKSGCGKSTIAQRFIKEGWVNLDGDDMRNSINQDLGLSVDDREKNNTRVAQLAMILQRQHPVVVSVICPTNEIRRKVHFICKPIWVWVDKNVHQVTDKNIFEEPSWYDLKINHNKLTRNESFAKIKDFIKTF